jgi:hypothetical protein
MENGIARLTVLLISALAILSALTPFSASYAQTGNITGKVTDASGAPFPGVFINVLDQNGCLSPNALNVKTQANGTYTASNLPAGTYKLYYSRPQGDRYIGQWYQNKKDFETATPVSVTAGQTTSGIDAQLVEGGKITGKVTTPAGQGLADVWVFISGPGFSTAFTDANGDYLAQGLPSGNYRVWFRPPGSANYLVEYFNDKPDANSADAVPVTEGQTAAHIDAQLAEGGEISGRVTNAASQGVAGVIVTASLNNAIKASANTDANGDYRLRGLAAGSYIVRFSAPSQNLATEWYKDKNSLQLADTVLVTPGAIAIGIDAQLAPGAKICGTVETPVGADLQAVPATAFDLNNTEMEYGWVDANGDFCIQGLPAGTYKIRFRDVHEHTDVKCGQTVLAQTWYDRQAVFETADPVKVVVNNPVTIHTRMDFGGAISGMVTGPLGVPLQDVQVWVHDSQQHQVISWHTSADGKYRISGIPAGSYKVLFDPPPPFGPFWYQQKNAFDQADAVTVAVSGETPHIDGQCPYPYRLYLPLIKNY